jgi:flagellar biosynthetic protein FlhB
MSDDQDDSQKTEDPTPKKLEDARRKGQVPLSREVNNWMMLFAGTFVILALGPSMMKDLLFTLRTYLEMSHELPMMPGGMKIVVMDALMDVLKILALPLMLFIAAAFLGPYLQIGPLFAPEILKMDISKISIFKGFGRLFSMKSVMEFVKGILKIGIVSVVGYMILLPFYGGVEHMVGLPIEQMLIELKALVVRLMMGILVVLFVIAGIDLVYQRYEHFKKMRMTKQEVKDEYRQSEGDPHVKAKLRQLRQEKARARMMQSVPDADVIITNPTHYSVALKYDPATMEAPIVLAKGVDELAMRIREVAKEHDIIIFPSPPLARVLFDTVDIDEAVPPEHYKAVAEVISYVFKLKGKLK